MNLRYQHNLAIHKDVVQKAVDFLKNHTALSSYEIDSVIEAAVYSVYKKGKSHQNYEGHKEMDPKSFGREVVLSCTEKGIKIKRVPKNVENEVKDHFEGIDHNVLDKTFVILDAQPDLNEEDRGRVVVQSVLDSLNDKDSFDGDIDYEIFGQKLKNNLAKIRKEKERSLAVDKLMDVFLGEDNYGESINDAFPYYQQKYNLKDDDFADYFDKLFVEGWDVPMDNNSNFEGDHDYLFKKLKAKIQTKVAQHKEKHAVKKEVRQEKHAHNKAKRKEHRKEHGSVIGNILTGGALGITKATANKAKDIVQAKKAKKQAKKDAAQALLDAKTAAANQQATTPISPDVTATATTLQAGAATLPPMATTPPDMGTGAGSSGGGGGGDSQPPMGGDFQQQEDQDQEDAEAEDQGPEQEEDVQDQEDVEDSPVEDQPEGPEMSDEQYAKTQYQKGMQEENKQFYPGEDEENEEIANFFGFRRKPKAVAEKEPLTDLLGHNKFSNLNGEQDDDHSSTKMWGTVIILAIIVTVVYFKFIKK